MPSYKSTFGSFLKQEDLNGKTPRAIVEHVALEDVKDTDTGQNAKKLVMHFVGKDKAMVLNRTNCEVMESITGTDDYEDWTGHAVVLWVDTTVRFGGKTVGGLRLRAPAKPIAVPPPPPPPMLTPEETVATGDITEDEVPF